MYPPAARPGCSLSDVKATAVCLVSRITNITTNTAVTYGVAPPVRPPGTHLRGEPLFDAHVSTDNGLSWTLLSSGVPAAIVTTGSLTAPMLATPSTAALLRVSRPAGFTTAT